MRLIKFLLRLRRHERRKAARQIRECWHEIDLTRQSFFLSGELIKSRSGDEEFYSADEIDHALRRTNRLMRRLER